MRQIEIENRQHSIRMQIIELKHRATGRTTRLVDACVKELYENIGQWVRIVDHHAGGPANKMIAHKVLERMEREHPKDKIEKRPHGIYIEMRIVSCPDREYCQAEIERLEKELKLLDAEK